MYFEDRTQAGSLLAARLVEQYRYENCAVVALSDGGVLVGEQIAKNGFYQANAENAELIRLKVDPAQDHYPTMSGHKSRFALRFLPLGELETGDIPFQLACC